MILMIYIKKIQIMKRYSSYIKENIDILSKSPEEIIKYVGGDVAGFNSYEDAVEEIEYVINTDFSL